MDDFEALLNDDLNDELTQLTQIKETQFIVDETIFEEKSTIYSTQNSLQNASRNSIQNHSRNGFSKYPHPNSVKLAGYNSNRTKLSSLNTNHSQIHNVSITNRNPIQNTQNNDIEKELRQILSKTKQYCNKFYKIISDENNFAEPINPVMPISLQKSPIIGISSGNSASTTQPPQTISQQQAQQKSDNLLQNMIPLDVELEYKLDNVLNNINKKLKIDSNKKMDLLKMDDMFIKNKHRAANVDYAAWYEALNEQQRKLFNLD